MTTGLLIELGLSLAGVAVLVAATYFLGAWRTARVTLDAAQNRLGFDEPDFEPGDWMISSDERSAVALSRDGAEIGLVFVMGDDFATRRLSRSAARITRQADAILFLLKEPSRRAVRVAAPDEAAAEQWLLRLRGERV
ncbi:MAG: hypothetical protein ACK4NP_14460 [Parvularculaceae bacterium]